MSLLAGCSSPSGNNGGGGSGGGSSTPSVTTSGNWQFQMTQTAGPPTFASLAGFINQQGNSGSASNFTTAAFQSFDNPPSSCYDTSTPIPLDGSVLGTQLLLRSFSVDGQFLTVNATANAAGTQMSGSWSVSEGCADGAKGTLTGTEYSALTGHYTGTVTGSSPAQTISLAVTQSGPGAGDGTFPISGTAAFSGFGCFTTGTLGTAAGTVIGSMVNLTFTTNDANGANAVLTGTIDPGADTLTLTSIAITGGNCKGTLGGAVLTIPASS